MAHRKIAERSLDLDQFLDLVGGDISLLHEVAELGAADVFRLVTVVEAAESAAEMAPLAHELKGVLLNLTASAAAKRAATVETVAKAGDFDSAKVEFARARPIFDDVVAKLTSVALESQRAS